MKRLLVFILIILIFFSAAKAFVTADKNAKDVADFLNSNTLFRLEDGTVTILNEKISLR